MGQAKRRGSFEDRVKQSIEAREAKIEETKRKAQEWWESLTLEQKAAEIEKMQKRERARKRALQLLALSSAFK